MRVLLLACCAFSSIFAAAQDGKFKFALGEEYELPRRSEDLAFFGNDRDGIVNLSMKKEELILVRFDPATLKRSAEQKIDLDATRNSNSETLVDFHNGGGYYWLHSDWDKSGEREKLFCDEVDVTGGKLKSVNKLLLETTRIAGASEARGWYSYKTVNKYQVNYDAEHKYVLVSYRLFPEFRNDKKNYDRLGFQVFDDHMNKVWGGEFRMPYTEAVMDNADFSIDGSGNAYLLAKVYESDARREKDKEGKPGYHYELMKFGDKQQMRIAKISIGENFIRESSLLEAGNHQMLVAGSYSKEAKGVGTDGIFLAQVEPDGQVKKYRNGFYSFPHEELAKFERGRRKRKLERDDDYEQPFLKVRAVLASNEGGLFVACEEYHSETTCYTSRYGTTTCTTTYYYDDMLGARIGADGNFLWARKIPKRQKGTMGTGTMSFKLVADATGFYFLYLDNKKNLNLPEDAQPYRHIDGYGGQVMVARIDPDGNVTKQILFDTREEDIKIFPTQFRRLNNHQFVGRAQVKRGLYKPLLITVSGDQLSESASR